MNKSVHIGDGRMKDFVGNELHIGDCVIYARTAGHGISMSIEEIIGFTPKMVKANPHSKFHEYNLLKPNNCVLFKRQDGRFAYTIQMVQSVG